MVTVHREVETKYDADASFTMPPLVEVLEASGAVAGLGSLTEADGGTLQLAATYYDTADLRLAAAGLSLRRRTGGTDAGWHLKVADGVGGRSELGLPLGDDGETVPDELVGLVLARTGGRPLVPVARIDTTRRVRRLVGPGDRVLLEVADDQVAARRLDPADGPADRPADRIWREVEVELVDGDTTLLRALGDALGERGLVPSQASSKVSRVLGRDGSAAPPGGSAGLGRRSSASDVVLAYIRAQVELLRSNDLRVRLDAEGGVHQMRVATRRLRSVLSTFTPVVDRSVVGPLGEELKWLAGVLGTARDADVVRARLVEAARAERTEHLLAPTVVADIEYGLGEALTTARREVLDQLDDERYLTLLGDLERLLEDPPLLPAAAQPAKALLPPRVARNVVAIRRAMKAARSAEGEARVEALHDARKAAKRTRYAAEAVAPLAGKRAEALAQAMELVQEAMGDYLDGLAARDRLRELAGAATDPAVAFTYGRLHAVAQLRGEQAEERLGEVRAVLRKKAVRRWLS